ncbi:acetyl-CoA carboxylase biotin carboxyl carrier protein [Enterococcus sp. LJL98]
MEQKELIELLNLVGQSNLMEFHLKDGQFELYLNKNTLSKGQTAVVNQTSETLVETTPVTVAPVATSPAPISVTPVVETEPTVVAGTDIVSPLVGVAYLQAAPDKPNFKQVGDQVTKGEVVCIVEAMKVMNEITSDVTGEIVAVLVENEQVVEFNQPLFRVKEGS